MKSGAISKALHERRLGHNSSLPCCSCLLHTTPRHASPLFFTSPPPPTSCPPQAVAEKNAAIMESEDCQRRLGLANRLITALASEGERWELTVAQLEKDYKVRSWVGGQGLCMRRGVLGLGCSPYPTLLRH